MKRLAIETSSTACSVALSVDGNITDEHVVEPRAHTRILMPMIDRLLRDANLRPAELDAVVLGNGPGSFIGMRIGASVAQGICFAANIDLIPLSSLAAIAAEVFSTSDAERVVVTQDARMNEVYVGTYITDADHLPQLVGEEYIAPSGDKDLGKGAFVAAGAGWLRYPELRASHEARIAGQSDIVEPSARYLLVMADAGHVTPIRPAALAPAYLRHKVAEPQVSAD